MVNMSISSTIKECKYPSVTINLSFGVFMVLIIILICFMTNNETIKYATRKTTNIIWTIFNQSIDSKILDIGPGVTLTPDGIGITVLAIYMSFLFKFFDKVS